MYFIVVVASCHARMHDTHENFISASFCALYIYVCAFFFD
jgi:hypothetical protein